MPAAQFISFEGTEGVGKTTAINNLCHNLDAKGIEYVHTREPGGSSFAEKLREILLNPNTNINDDTELLLIFTARNDHIDKVIKPALTAGKWVICDRFTDSTIAYQGFGRCPNLLEIQTLPPNVEKIKQLINMFVTVKPDKTIWLDLPVLEGIERASKRSQADRFEKEAIAFFQRVYQGYEYIKETEPDRFIRINATGSSKQVSKRIWKEIVSV